MSSKASITSKTSKSKKGRAVVARGGKKRRKWPWVLGSLAAFLSVNIYLSNYTLQLNRLTVWLPRLPSAFDGFRVVLLSDWHSARYGDNNEKLLDMIRNESPDIIAMTGDFVESLSDLAGFGTLCRALADIAPCYYVTGNHEWGGRAAREARAMAGECGVVNLDNAWEYLTRQGQSICLVGIEDLGGPKDQLSVAEVAKMARGGDNPFLLMLCHRYDRWYSFVDQRVDLTLAGHAHGGVIRLPFTDGLYGPGHVFLPQRTSGISREGGAVMVTSRGLGNPERIPMRLFNPPEVLSLTLRAGENKTP
ncbi:MAG: metallophosphoesterase [Oscillospiraceae bacterium]|nr:metallophosphoesterase [Oscillospiraceae bacterium]